MLFLRFLCQNNEIVPFRNLCNVIKHCSQIPPEFPEFSRLMLLIIVWLLLFSIDVESLL